MSDKTSHVTDPQQAGDNAGRSSRQEEDTATRELHESIQLFPETPEQKGKTELQIAGAYNENFWQSMREDARNRRQFTSRADSIAPLMAYLAHLEREDG